MKILFPIAITLVAQVFITTADAHIRRQPAPLLSNPIYAWLPKYALSRCCGLLLRLFAVFVVPIGGASLMFSTSAISLSSFVAWRQGEVLKAREWCAIALIVVAVLMRSL